VVRREGDDRRAGAGRGGNDLDKAVARRRRPGDGGSQDVAEARNDGFRVPKSASRLISGRTG
jgi:hypothetical protein